MRIYLNNLIPFMIALILLTSCDEPDSYSAVPDSMKGDLQEWAGILARYWCFSISDSLNPGKPDDTELLSLIQSCESNPEAWAYLYSCIADTIAILEPPDPACQQ